MMMKHKKLLEWLGRTGMLLESQITGSGMSKALNDLLLEGKVDIVPHPTVKDGKAPAAAVVLKPSAPKPIP
jgi:hypothetical protein